LFTACYHGNAIVAPLAAWRADRCLATRNNIRNLIVACVYSVAGVFYLATRHNIYAFPATIVQMGHNHKPSMKPLKLYWIRDKIYHATLYSIVIPNDSFLNIQKYLHFSDNPNPSIQDRENPNYDIIKKSDKYSCPKYKIFSISQQNQ
jgi:hypothetical protein